MIIEWLIELVLSVVAGLFSILPTWVVDDSSLHTMDGTAIGVASLNGWVPERLLFQLVILGVAVKGFFLAWYGVVFVWRMLPFNG